MSASTFRCPFHSRPVACCYAGGTCVVFTEVLSQLEVVYGLHLNGHFEDVAKLLALTLLPEAAVTRQHLESTMQDQRERSSAGCRGHMTTMIGRTLLVLSYRVLYASAASNKSYAIAHGLA